MAIRQLTPAEMATLEDQYRNGTLSTEALAETWSCSVDWIRKQAQLGGWVRTKARNGRPTVVFSEADTRRLRFLVEDGELSLDTIANRFHIARKTLAELAKEHGWRTPHATDRPPGQPAPPAVDGDLYQRALTILRRRYPLVYSAHITEGERGRGWVWVGTRRITAAEAVAEALEEPMTRMRPPVRSEVPVEMAGAMA